MDVKLKLPYTKKLEGWQLATGLKDKDIWEMIGVTKSYYYNILKRGRMPGALICKKMEERLSIKFSSTDFDWQECLK